MKKVFLSLLVFTSLSIATYAFAEVTYTPIVGVPRIDGNELSTEAYVNAIYFLAITIAALLAIVKIIFAGVKYVLSDVVTDKGGAIKDIQGALLGLLIVLSAVLILNTINPNLRKLDIFANAPSLENINSPELRTGTKVRIGDSRSGICVGKNLWESMTTFVCSEKWEKDLAEFKRSCLEDAGGTITIDFIQDTRCVSK